MTTGQWLAFAGVTTLRRVLARPAVRRALDAVTGTALLGLGARLALTGSR